MVLKWHWDIHTAHLTYLLEIDRYKKVDVRAPGMKFAE